MLTRKVFFVSLFFIVSGMSCSNINRKVNHPGVRNAHSMAYNAKDNYILLYGGADEKAVLSETWILKDTIWKKSESISMPPGRTFGALVYDEPNNRFILFGGSKVLFGGDALGNHMLLNDLWEYTDGQWQELKTKNSPGRRAEAAMAFDSHRRRIVLFGGYQFSEDGSSYMKLNDTWEFDGTDWKMIHSAGPSQRNGSVMVYDHQKEAIVLYGGNMLRTKKDSTDFNGVSWVWNGQQWRSNTIRFPLIYNLSATYHLAEESTVLFGGYKNGERLNDTWKLKDTVTRVISTVNPSARNHAAMAYNTKSKIIVLFGGHDGYNIYGDMWFFKNDQWQQVYSEKPLKRIDNQH